MKPACLSKTSCAENSPVVLSMELITLVSQFNSSLQSLNLEHNNITGEGAKLLAASLQAAEGGGLALRSLNLKGNPLEDTGGTALADMLKVRFIPVRALIGKFPGTCMSFGKRLSIRQI